MPRFAANLSFLFAEIPFLDRFAAAANAGFQGAEVLFPYAWPADEIAARLDAHRLTLALFNAPPGDWEGGERGIAGIPGRETELEDGIAHALDYAAKLGVRQIHVLAGLTHHGANRDSYMRGIASAARMAAPHGVDILIEPINARDMPGYLLKRTSDAAALIAEIGAPNVRLQLDLYHRQITEGDVARAITQFAPLTAHYQIASPPDRGEPDAGELDFAYLLRLIDATGYRGWIGCEYRPRNGTEAGLGWMERLARRAL